MDVVADALSRMVLGLRLRLRSERQTDSVKALLTLLLDGKGENTMRSCIVTADRGYGKDTFSELMGSFGLSSIFAIPDHVMK